MDRLVEHVFVMEGEGKVRDYPGNYTDYREWRDAQPKTNARSGKPASAEVKSPKPEVVATPVNGTTAKRKLSFKEIREYETLEKEIESLEQRKTLIVTLLNTGGHHEQLTAWAREIEQIDQTIAEKSDRWLELAEFI